jgi:hypothetical protein
MLLPVFKLISLDLFLRVASVAFHHATTAQDCSQMKINAVSVFSLRPFSGRPQERLERQQTAGLSASPALHMAGTVISIP